MNRVWRRLRMRVLPRASRVVLPISPRSDLKKLGGRYGGWVVPTTMLSDSSICYCVGVGEDITFDLALIDAYGCHVYAFDPTPRAIEHVRLNATGIDRYHFQGEGLWSEDTVLKFYAPLDERHVSHSAVNLGNTSEFFEAPCRRLSSLMRELGHTVIDLLKLDVEGAEYEVLDSMIQDRIVPRVLCVEFDQPVPYKKTLAMVKRLLRCGYGLVAIDGWNYTFVHAEMTPTD